MRKKSLLILLLLISCFSSKTVLAETIILKTGQEVEGKVIEKTDKYIKMDIQGVTLTYYFDEIKSIDGKELDQGSVSSAVPPVEAKELEADGAFEENTADAGVSGMDIVQKMMVNYKNMKSYSAEGAIEDDVTMAGAAQKSMKRFTIKLAKPDFYKIVSQNVGPYSMHMEQAVWNAGNGPFFVIDNHYQKSTTDQIAISESAGVFGTYLIPGLFLDIGIKPFDQISHVKLAGSQRVNGQDCFVLTGESKISTDDRYWISKDKYLIVRHAYKMDKKPEIPQLTGEKLDESLKAMGMAVNDTNRAKMMQMMDMAKSALINFKIQRMAHQEDYINIRVDTDILQAEFNYKIPQAAQQALMQGHRQNLMSNVFNNMDGLKYSMSAAQGAQLSAQEASVLESKLAEKPDDFGTRMELLGYYFIKKSPEERLKRLEHIKWIVQNKPDYPGGELVAPFLEVIPMLQGEEAYDEVKQMWMDQLLKNPNNVAVLKNAASFLRLSDGNLSNKLLEKAKAIDPKATAENTL